MPLMKGETKQRHLTYLALFAMLMLFLGPLTTQILAIAAYTPSNNQQHLHQHIVKNSTEQHHLHNKKLAKANSAPLSHHSMSACGYCDLVHSPILFTYVPVIANAPPYFQQYISHHTEIIFLPLYNTSLSRAPPSFS